MKASNLIIHLEDAIRSYGDLEVSCKAGDSYFRTDWTSYNGEEDEIVIECKDLNY